MNDVQTAGREGSKPSVRVQQRTAGLQGKPTLLHIRAVDVQLARANARQGSKPETMESRGVFPVIYIHLRLRSAQKWATCTEEM